VENIVVQYVEAGNFWDDPRRLRTSREVAGIFGLWRSPGDNTSRRDRLHTYHNRNE